MSMNIGAYTACLHNYDFAEALGILKTNGLTGAESMSADSFPRLIVQSIRSWPLRPPARTTWHIRG